jgi:hypothetical protein
MQNPDGSNAFLCGVQFASPFAWETETALIRATRCAYGIFPSMQADSLPAVPLSPRCHAAEVTTQALNVLYRIC